MRFPLLQLPGVVPPSLNHIAKIDRLHSLCKQKHPFAFTLAFTRMLNCKDLRIFSIRCKSVDYCGWVRTVVRTRRYARTDASAPRYGHVRTTVATCRSCTVNKILNAFCCIFRVLGKKTEARPAVRERRQLSTAFPLMRKLSKCSPFAPRMLSGSRSTPSNELLVTLTFSMFMRSS